MSRERETVHETWRLSCDLPRSLDADVRDIAEWKGDTLPSFVKWSVDLRRKIGIQQKVAREQGSNPAIYVEGDRLDLKSLFEKYANEPTSSQSFIFPQSFGTDLQRLAGHANETPDVYATKAVTLAVGFMQVIREKNYTNEEMMYRVGRHRYFIKK